LVKKKTSKKRTVKKTVKRKVTKTKVVKRSPAKKKTVKRKAKKSAASKKVTGPMEKAEESLKKLFSQPMKPIKIHSVPVKTTQTLSLHSLGYTMAILHAVCVLATALLGKFGYAKVAVELMDNFLLTYSDSILGIIAGTAEAAVWGLVIGIVFAWLYNKLI